jgi:hypothetical protein
MTRNLVWALTGAATVSLVVSHAASATPPLPRSTPCSAPEFQKIGELVVPPCGATADTVTVSGRVIVTNRKPAEIAHALLLRKGKIIAHGAVAASADDPNAADLSFEYTEPAASYLTPIDFVIAPQCGPALSISVDRPGRCP